VYEGVIIMEHPHISAHNAKLYYARMMQEAEDSRRAKKLFAAKQDGNFILKYFSRFEFPHRQHAQETLHSST
jgi:hypothetical protein